MAVKCLAVVWIIFMCETLQNIMHNVSSLTIKKDIVYRIGDELKLSCSPEFGNSSTWWFDGKPLYNNTIRMNDGSYVLQISNVSIKNQGTYWCRSSWQQGMNVTVLIGDLPSPPRNLYTTSIEMNKILHWTSALSTDDLPVHYTVIIECTTQCNDSTTEGELFVPALLDKCNGLKHINGKNYSCDLQSADLFHQYRATVYAINPLGNSSNSILFQRPDIGEPKTTPAPPVAMKATEVQPGKVKVSWKNADSFRTNLVCYRITYKRERDKNTMKTLPDQCKTDTSVLIDNVDADTTYKFFVMRQFRTSILNSSFSDPADVSLHTKYQTPDQPPQNLKCELMTENSRNDTIMLTWEPPAKQYRNGPLTVYEIYYHMAESANSSMIVNASQTQANLTVAAHLGNKLEIYSRVCNRAGSCSGISNSCSVPLSGLSKSGKKISDSNHTTFTIIGIVLSLLAVIAVIVIIIVLYYRCRKKKKNPSSILPPDIDEPYPGWYSEPENPSDDYAAPLVRVQQCIETSNQKWWPIITRDL